MKIGNIETAKSVRRSIRESNPSIYDPAANEETGLFYSPRELEELLRHELIGERGLANLPVRTRSKTAKELLCKALGYPTPNSFKKTNPRFPHPNIDLYVQQSNNLQIWNQEVDASRRYVIIAIKDDVISNVHVIAGADLSQFDKTGTLTRKFQASRILDTPESKLISPSDTTEFIEKMRPLTHLEELSDVSPVDPPQVGKILTVSSIYRTLVSLIGKSFSDPGATQERNRGTAVHREASTALGMRSFADNGQFPDILSQALEVKLQLARTIDLGLELPSSYNPVASTNGILSVRDIRYAIFFADRSGSSFTLSRLIVTTGQDFFKEFRQFEGKVSNSKLQLRLPSSWF